jgi:uncharacterized protein DUF1638
MTAVPETAGSDPKGLTPTGIEPKGLTPTGIEPRGLTPKGSDPAVAPRVVVSCGALALHVRQIAKRRGWELDVRPVPPELHNRPERIRAAVEAAANGDEVVVAYAHCGADLAGYETLPGAHCYEVFGAEHETATYFLTDFLVRSFERVVWRGLGLDRHPELRDDYFRNYERVVWLAQVPTPELLAQAEAAAAKLGLALEVRETGDQGLEQALERLLEGREC